MQNRNSEYMSRAVGKERRYLVDEWENLFKESELPQFNHFLGPHLSTNFVRLPQEDRSSSSMPAHMA